MNKGYKTREIVQQTKRSRPNMLHISIKASHIY